MAGQIRFPDAEHRQRLRALVGRAGWDAVVISDERTTWHLTGFGAGQPIGSAARPRVVLDADGALAYLVPRSTARCDGEMAAGIDVLPYSKHSSRVGPTAAGRTASRGAVKTTESMASRGIARSGRESSSSWTRVPR